MYLFLFFCLQSVFLHTESCVFWIVTLRTCQLVTFHFSTIPPFVFMCVLRIAFCSQVSEWESCPAAWRGQWEHIIWIPTAAAQTLYRMYKKPACGQQGTVWSMLSWLNTHCHEACRLIDFYVVSLYFFYLFGWQTIYCRHLRTPLQWKCKFGLKATLTKTWGMLMLLALHLFFWFSFLSVWISLVNM